MAVKKAESQHIIKYKGIKAFKASHPDIRKIKRKKDAPSIHGNKVWDSSFVLMDFLHSFPPGKHLSALDVGCGWGVLSSYLAKKHHAAVIGLDADDAVEPYFDYHGEKNKVALRFLHGKISSLKKNQLQHIDMIVGADICFWPELEKDWKKMIKRALDAGVQQIYLADPGRSPFWDLVKYCEKKFAAQVWSHDIDKPFYSEKYILEIIR